MKKINEIFYSIQGEGRWAGTPMIFVRFSGCNLKCDFCDTEHESGKDMTDEEIIAEIKKYPADRVCFTGGEPSLQLTADLIEKLQDIGKLIHIETNGLRKLPEAIDWVTLSPKTDYNTLKVQRIDEIKVVFGSNYGKPYYLPAWEMISAAHRYLQPLSQTNTAEVIEYIKQHPEWKISVQLQKILSFQ